MKNKKGQFAPFFLFMIGIIILIIAFSLASPLIKSSNTARSGMDCNNESLSTGQKITCTVTDITSPFVVAVLLGLGGLALGSKLIGG